MKIVKTGNVVLGVEEYYFDGVRFLFRNGVDKNIVTFSAFPPKDVAQKYNYIKDFLDTGFAFFAFLDTEKPSNDPRGTYYLDEEYGDTYLQKIHQIISMLSDVKNHDATWLIGSSKGGVGALLLGLTFNYKNILIMAPQARLAKYIKKRSNEIISFMTKGSEKSFQKLDNILFGKIKKIDKSIPWNITICCGEKDNYHLVELDILEKCFWFVDVEMVRITIEGSHDNLAISNYRALLKEMILN